MRIKPIGMETWFHCYLVISPKPGREGYLRARLHPVFPSKRRGELVTTPFVFRIPWGDQGIAVTLSKTDVLSVVVLPLDTAMPT